MQIYLIMALTVRGKSDAKGVVATNELVSIGDFFTGHVVPELQAPIGAGSNVLKADALKFLTTFRSQARGAAGALSPPPPSPSPPCVYFCAGGLCWEHAFDLVLHDT